MKNSQIPRHFFFLLVATAIPYSTASMAADADNTGWYVGANVGQSSNKIDDGRITSGLLSGGITTFGGLSTSSIDDNNSSVGGKLFLGYQLNQYFALEAGYFNLGNLGFTAHTIPPGTLDGTMKARGGNLDIVGSYPFSDSWSGFVRAGVTYNHVNSDFSSTGAVQLLRSAYSDNSADYKIGLGIDYAISKSMSVRLEGERYRLDDAVNYQENVNLISIGFVYRFGGGTSTHVAVASRSTVPEPAPEPIVEAPPPPIAPAPKMPMHVNFSADSFFDYDKAKLKPEGEKSLQKFIHDLDGVRYEKIQIVGHTDRLGSVKYNQNLSLRRAETVKRYLIDQHIDEQKITTTGVGSSEPMTKPDACKGGKPTTKLIACLSPDRRVQIDVSGTK